MEITIENRIQIKHIPNILKNILTNELRIPNPKFEEAVNSGRSTWNIPQFIMNFIVISDDTILIPRGMRQWVINKSKDLDIEYTIIDNRSSFDYMDIDSSKIKYRPYQYDAVLNLMSCSTEGVLVAPAGSGKTVMGLSIIPLLGQPTLWLTHTGPLANQAIERAKSFLPNIGKIGLIGKGKWEIGDTVTIGMIQTLVKNVEELIKLRDRFGIVIIDECLPKGTNILMLDGSLKDVSEVKNGDVTTFGTVTNKFSRTTNRIVTLIGEWGKIEGTETHRLPYIKNSSHGNSDIVIGEMSEIKEGDLLLILKDKYKNTDMYPIGDSAAYRYEPVTCKTVNNRLETVYDFTTDKHFFIANGVLSSNCHHCPSRTFTDVVSQLNPKYLYGLTATPYRRDKLEKLMFQTIGTSTTVIPIGKVKEYGGIIIPVIKPVYVPSDTVESNDLQRIIKEYIVDNEFRNNMIAKDVIKEAEAGHYCIVLSERVRHCEMLFDIISKSWSKVGFATGKHAKKIVNEQIRMLESGEITVLISTYSLLSEGFDVPKLDRGFLASPFRTEARCEQLLGRIQRTFPGKTEAVIYDYVDREIGVLYNQFNSKKQGRIQVYKRLGAKMTQ